MSRSWLDRGQKTRLAWAWEATSPASPAKTNDVRDVAIRNPPIGWSTQNEPFRGQIEAVTPPLGGVKRPQSPGEVGHSRFL
jgi:hypothetical protein